MKFKVQTDDKPLIPLFPTKLINELPVHIQRFRMRLMRFDFTIKRIPGKLLYTADALSRSQREDKAHETKPCNDLHDEVDCYVNAVLVTLPASDQRQKCEVRNAGLIGKKQLKETCCIHE